MALTEGDRAPAAALRDADGNSLPLQSLLAAGPVLLTFFKVSCPTCQLTLPFLNRLDGGLAQVVNVSQDSPEATARFVAHYGVTARVLYDAAAEEYPASNAFGITHVPWMFLIERPGTIAWEWSGFQRLKLEWLGNRLNRPIFHPGELVPEMKAG